MCSGRVDLDFIVRAFQKGAGGVIIGGCWPGECHYVTEGNYDALANMYIARALLERVGVDPSRLRLEWIAASEGNRFAEVMTGFAQHVTDLGPLFDDDDSAAADKLGLDLEALHRLVPYLKLVERERLRVPPPKTEERYNEFFGRQETRALIGELVDEKLRMSQIQLLLGERPRTTAELAQVLGLTPSEVARYVQSSSRHGLVRYDQQSSCYVLAQSRA